MIALTLLLAMAAGGQGPGCGPEAARLLAEAEAERGTMDLFLRQAIDMAALQHAAGLPGAPAVVEARVWLRDPGCG